MKVYFERVGSEVNFVLCSESSVERSVMFRERERSEMYFVQRAM